MSIPAPQKIVNSVGDEENTELQALFVKCKIPEALQKLFAEKDFLEAHDITLLGDKRE